MSTTMSVVTGATGFIGSRLCAELLNRHVRVTALTHKDDAWAARLPTHVSLQECDMDSYHLLQLPPHDVFYHLAWEGATGSGRGDDTLQLKNAQRTLEALKAAHRLGCKRFVAVGTVYEKLLPQIITHADFRQADFYLLSKEYAHHMCAKLAAKLGIDFVWATFFHPIGKFIKLEQMFAYAVKGLLDNNPPAFGPAQEPYDITAVDNIAYGLYLLGTSDRLTQNYYYIGSGAPKRMYEYLEEARLILGVDTELKIGERPDDGMRFDFDWFDTSPLIRDTGYKPTVSFEQAVRDVAEWVIHC